MCVPNSSEISFFVYYSISVLRIFTNSLRYHEIAIQIVYLSDPDAITYPLILQYCHAEPRGPYRFVDSGFNTETFLHMPWTCGSRYRKSTGGRGNLARIRFCRGIIRRALISVVALRGAQLARKAARMRRRYVTSVRINAIQDPNCNLSAWIAANASGKRIEDLSTPCVFG